MSAWQVIVGDFCLAGWYFEDFGSFESVDLKSENDGLKGLMSLFGSTAVMGSREANGDGIVKDLYALFPITKSLD